MTAEQPRTHLTTVMHSPIRLAILGSLRHVQQVTFADLREALDLSAAELSRQLGILEQEGMVDIAKLRERRRPVTQVRLSDSGRERFEKYLTQLRLVVQGDIP
ncbi:MULTISPECIES: transcriptional regulator [unclassified Streptomyces]|uniref:transcriptional regulator n=1 Tax=unclassified Streptomyces TaxID=2593676 RepID=UPI001369B3F7|nr:MULTISPECIES: transcriptional regulator [unclassified Streptomyces]NEA02220.1 helix-turn-helix domain-containing protein [Streptomyces sp. SID10116]MYY80816.1 helix-turn-helix domain-containing protein [Streptomyces sp. SID335]MYZ13230.1 helix-turn-helix domain-containing protein [Streptomyces sp. SID337]NDZ88289.1 helix-turn-helix domain-containing protein [Streptomyces sp. SID10115]NEB49942.1 helix-turn-helix domain-containing protein [Streptomyces sp. SID339]